MSCISNMFESYNAHLKHDCGYIEILHLPTSPKPYNIKRECEEPFKLHSIAKASCCHLSPNRKRVMHHG